MAPSFIHHFPVACDITRFANYGVQSKADFYCTTHAALLPLTRPKKSASAYSIGSVDPYYGSAVEFYLLF